MGSGFGSRFRVVDSPGEASGSKLTSIGAGGVGFGFGVDCFMDGF